MSTLTMLDSITLTELEWAYSSHRPDAFAGYVGGNWPTFAQLEALFSKVAGLHLLSIAVNAGQDADCLDVEPGDAANAQVYGWFKRQQARGAWKPCLYTSASNVHALISTMTANGFARAAYRIWSAHYTNSPHICGPGTCGYPQADATQWTDAYLGRNIDASLLDVSFFHAAPKPPPPPPKPRPVPPPAHIVENDMPLLLNGKNAATPLLVPAGMTKLLLVATDRQQNLPPAKLDVGFQSPWHQQEVTVSWGSGVVEVALAPGATMGRVVRLDEGNVNVTWAWA